MSIPKWLDSALSDYGIAEKPGDESNRLIEAYHKSTKGEAGYTDNVPWCSSFVNYHLKLNGYAYTGLQLAHSWLKYGLPLAEGRVGCIVVLQRGPEPWQGHVGFLMRETQKTVLVLGGNQGDRVCIEPYAKSRVLAYRWPVEG